MSRASAFAVLGTAVLAVSAGAFVADRLAGRSQIERQAEALTGGDAAAGRAAVARRPCGGCHEIPGVGGAKGTVGPPLTRFARRAYIAGRLDNTPENLVAWIVDPHAADPRTAMPPMGVPPAEARDIAAFLYTLR